MAFWPHAIMECGKGMLAGLLFKSGNISQVKKMPSFAPGMILHTLQNQSMLSYAVLPAHSFNVALLGNMASSCLFKLQCSAMLNSDYFSELDMCSSLGMKQTKSVKAINVKSRIHVCRTV